MLRMIGLHEEADNTETMLENLTKVAPARALQLLEDSTHETYAEVRARVRDEEKTEAFARHDAVKLDAAIRNGGVQFHVKNVAGGMAAMPVDRQHAMKPRKNPKCGYKGKCKHVPRCEPVWGFACERDEATGFCTCPLPTVEGHIARNEGVRVKGTPAPKPKSVPKDRSFHGLTANTEALRKQLIPGELPYEKRLSQRDRMRTPMRTRLAAAMRRVMRTPWSMERDAVMADLRAQWMAAGQ